jgi:hypothetical protein
MFNFFAVRGGEHTIFFELCNNYFLLTVCKLCLTTVSMTCRLYSSQKKVMVCPPPLAVKKIKPIFYFFKLCNYI